MMAGLDGARWLKSRVQGDAITLDGDSEPHWTTSLAAIALRDEQRFVKWLLTCEGRKTMDAGSCGWPWAMDTFSWVEPTSYALLALKLNGETNHPRVKAGEEMLRSRVCADGGWNYGNANVMGADLPSFVPTTALAALALQNTGAAGALRFLDAKIKTHPSVLSLALTILCFNAFGMPATELAALLARRQRTDGSWQGQVHLTALALLALEASGGGRNVFRV
jgi:squalene cyclase